MKILHVTYHADSLGGAEVLLYRSLEGLDERGVHNIIAHQFPGKQTETRWPCYRIPGLGDPDGSAPKETDRLLREVLAREKPDLIHLYDIGNEETVKTCQTFAPSVLSINNHNAYCPGGNKYLPKSKEICERTFGLGCLASAFLTRCNSIRPAQLWRTYQKSSQMLKRRMPFLVLSRYQKEELIQNGIEEKNIFLHPPFTPLPNSPQEMDSESRIIVMAGRITAQKGWRLLLDALALVRSEFRLIVEGDGPDLGSMKAAAQELGLTRRFEFPGWRPRKNLEETYQAAAFAVLPSIWPEPFGMIGIEAFGYGKPAIAFASGGIPDWLDDKISGFLIQPFEVKKFAEKVEYLLTHPEQRQQMGLAGRRRAEKDFSKEAYINRLLSIYEQVLNNVA